MNSQRKVTLAVLFVMTVLLAGVSVFITIRIQQNNAAADANAGGFGQSATKDLYDDVEAAFNNQTCDKLIDKDAFSTLSSGISYSFTTEPVTEDQPKTCNFTFSNGVKGAFILHSYKSNSNIPNSVEELYETVNPYSFSEIVSLDTIGNTNGFYGINYGDSNCRLNLFNSQNEFYYATMLYATDKDCKGSEMSNFSIAVFSTIAPGIDKVIIDTTKANGRVAN